MFIVALFARIEQGRLAADADRPRRRPRRRRSTLADRRRASSRRRDRPRSRAKRASAHAPPGRELQRGATLTAKPPSRSRSADLPFIGQLGTITVHGQARAPVDEYRSLDPNAEARHEHGPEHGSQSERGSVLIAGLLLSLALLMLLGAAVDIGHAFIVRRDLTRRQTTPPSPAARRSTSTHSTRASSHSTHNKHKRRSASDHARRAASGDARSPAPAASPSDCKSEIPTILLRLVGLTTLTVAAQATAAPETP